MRKYSAIIDWFTCTFQFNEDNVAEFLNHLSRITGLTLVSDERRSRPGYTNGILIKALHDYQLVNFAVLAWGGDSQRGRAMFDLSGSSCGCIKDWRFIASFFEALDEPRITRVDVAVDLFQGQFTVDQAVDWYKEGMFKVGGRNPSTSTAGDWLAEHEGRTLYIGKAKNGKGLRCYEKGKQLGDFDSKWVRFEVQFGNRDRILPFDILLDPTKYFAAAYPALEKIIEESGERIDTVINTSQVCIQTILTALKRTYGKWINALVSNGIEITDLVEEIRINVVPARVQASAVVADVLRDTTKDAFDKWSNKNAI